MSDRFRTIWKTQNGVAVIDQRHLPHNLVTMELNTVDEVVSAIRDMVVRGAPLIGATASYGAVFAVRESVSHPDPFEYVKNAFIKLAASRPTAVNLFWALKRLQEVYDSSAGRLEFMWA